MTDFTTYIFWRPLFWLYHKIKTRRNKKMKKKKKEPTIDDIEILEDPCEAKKNEDED